MKLVCAILTLLQVILFQENCLPSLIAQETESQTPKAKFEALLKEHEAAGKAWSEQYDRFNVSETRASAIELQRRYLAWPGWTFAPRFLELAEGDPEDPAAVDALLQVVVEIGRPVSPNDKDLLPHYGRALELLIRDHLDAERLTTAVQSLGGFRSPSAERFLRTVLERSRDRDVRAVACMNLAGSLVAKRELRPWFEAAKKSPFQAFTTGRWDPSVLRHIQESDPQALSREAEELYERAITEYGDVVSWRDPNRPERQETIADSARKKLNNLRLSVGAVAPEIEGQDLDGRPMRLSDHRGKVVLLNFWGSWCGPCMAVVPRERSLVERLAGRRFALLGVNSDEDRGHAKEVMQKERMTWRSWWDGIPAGPIATRWGIRGWPTLFVIDTRGVIRHKADGYDDNVDRLLDTLLEEIGAEKPQPTKVRTADPPR